METIISDKEKDKVLNKIGNYTKLTENQDIAIAKLLIDKGYLLLRAKYQNGSIDVSLTNTGNLLIQKGGFARISREKFKRKAIQIALVSISYIAGLFTTKIIEFIWPLILSYITNN